MGDSCGGRVSSGGGEGWAWGPIDLGQQGAKTQILGFTLPKLRSKKLFTPDTSLSATQKISQLMKGGITEKKTDLLEGNPAKMAQTLVTLLVQQKLVKLD